jgi:hypothetical protein
MMAKPKLGRPLKYAARIPVAYTAEQLRLVDAAAKRAGLRRSEWIRTTTLAAATRPTGGADDV